MSELTEKFLTPEKAAIVDAVLSRHKPGRDRTTPDERRARKSAGQRRRREGERIAREHTTQVSMGDAE